MEILKTARPAARCRKLKTLTILLVRLEGLDRGPRQPRPHVLAGRRFTARDQGRVSSASSCGIFCGYRSLAGSFAEGAAVTAPRFKKAREERLRLPFLILALLLPLLELFVLLRLLPALSSSPASLLLRRGIELQWRTLAPGWAPVWMAESSGGFVEGDTLA